MEHLKAFEQEQQLIQKYSIDKAFTVWAMGLYLNTSDLMQLANDYLTDAENDHKIDFLYFDEDEKLLFIVQGYHSNQIKDSAKSNKAADLNAAIAWLLQGDMEQFNANMKPKVEQIRTALSNGNLLHIDLVFAHNCGESKEVDIELKTASASLTEQLKDYAVAVTYVELGNPSLERLYLKKTANINISDTLDCPSVIIYEENTSEWKSAILTVTGDWLRILYNQYQTQLFSANYRGYLGESRNKVNRGIKNSAEREPANFWVYNNGITILTQNYERKPDRTILHGISIINGAQTTGSLGQILEGVDLNSVKIMARIVQSSNSVLVGNIVKFNNSQNRITSWDNFGNDTRQIELQRELKDLNYEYSIKRGFDSRDNILNIETIIQPLLAFLGKYKDAGRSKLTIFETRTLYSEAFDRVHARHLLFVSCLSSTLYSIKDEYKAKMYADNPSTSDKRVFQCFQQIRFRYYLMAIIGEILTKIYTNLTDKGNISFMPNVSDAHVVRYDQLVEMIKPVIRTLVIQIVNYDNEKDVMMFFNDVNSLSNIAIKVESIVAGLRSVFKESEKIFTDFGKLICNG